MLIRAIFSKAGWHSSRPRSLLELTFAGKCQISNIRDINSPTTLALVSRVDVDVIISVCCPQILKPSVLKIPKYGCLNIHPGLLPQIRGADPTFWTWKLKNNYGGVTAHLMDEGIDTGPILVTGRFSVSPSDGEAEIRERALTLAPSVLLEAVKTLDLNKIPPSQEEGIFYPLPKRKPLKNLLGELKYLFRSLKETHDYEIFRANSRCIILDKDHGS
jgi:methionyl-tRNA formyltransferase